MADEIRDKQAILARFRAGTDRLTAALERLDDEQMLAPNAVGVWSLRDTLSHLANPWLGEQLQAYLGGRAPDPLTATGTTTPPGPEFDLTTNDGRNAWRQAVRAGESLEEVRDRYAAFVTSMERLINALPDEDFERSFAIQFSDFVGLVRPALDGEPGFPLWQWLRGDTWHHVEDHLPAFEAAAQARGS